MEDQSDSQSLFYNRQSFIQKLSSVRSFDDINDKESASSFMPKDSLIQVKGLTDKSRISHSNYSEVNQSQLHGLLEQSDSVGNINKFERLSENDNFIDQISEFSRDQLEQLSHKCACKKYKCYKYNCPCFSAVNQRCIKGPCCELCIQEKSLRLLLQQKEKVSEQQIRKKMEKQKLRKKVAKKARRREIAKGNYEFIYCSCKKSNCMKKYCPCYSANKKCNQCCICEGCHNNQQYQALDIIIKGGIKQSSLGKISHDSSSQRLSENSQEDILSVQISDYFQQTPLDYGEFELNKDMEFQPANFDQYSQ